MTEFVSQEPSAAYRPGVCNIGPAEIARRRRSAVVTTLLAVVAAAGLVLSGIPPPARILLWPVASAAAITWLQAIRRFCVAFGAAGFLNFDELGAIMPVADRSARRADRRTAIRMILEGAGYGLLAAVALVLLPV